MGKVGGPSVNSGEVTGLPQVCWETPWDIWVFWNLGGSFWVPLRVPGDRHYVKCGAPLFDIFESQRGGFLTQIGHPTVILGVPVWW